jgi:FAD synthase
MFTVKFLKRKKKQQKFATIKKLKTQKNKREMKIGF